MNHYELRELFITQLSKAQSTLERIAYARVVASTNQEAQLTLDRLERETAEVIESLEEQMSLIALSN